MSEENKQKANISQTLLYALIALAVDAVLIIAGYLCKEFIPRGDVFYWGSILLLIFCLIFSNIAFRIFLRFVNKTTVEKSNLRTDSMMKQIAEHPRQEWIKFRILCFLILGYILLLLITSLAIPFFYGSSGLCAGAVVGNLLSVYYLMGYISRIPFKKEKADFSYALPAKDYPILYNLVKKAAGNTCWHRKIHIYASHDPYNSLSSAFISAPDNRNIVIGLGPVLLSVLDEEELFQVLLHEFGHMEGEDLYRKRLYAFLSHFIMSNPPLAIPSILDWSLVFFAFYLTYHGERYFRFVSKQQEEEADSYAKRLGNPEKQASAFAKSYCYEYYEQELRFGDSFYVPEQLPQHWHTEHAAKYRQALVSRETFWRQLLEQQLPRKADTHPTFRQRWEALGFCPYSLSPSPTDTPFAQECRKAVESADMEFCKSLQPYYEEDRKTHYLDLLDTITVFEAETEARSPDELRPVISAYMRLGKPEAAEHICDSILEKYDSPYTTAYASYTKGILLFQRYDKAGLPYIWQAMENNSNYIEDGLEAIGTFVRMMGLQEELEYYQEHSSELRQRIWDRNTPGITTRAKLTVCDLPDGWLDEILRFILNAGAEHIDKVYLVKEISNEAYQPSSFILRFRETYPDENLAQIYDQIYDKIFCLLDDWPEDWEFALYLYEADMEKALNRIDGCCIYDSTAK